MISLRHLPEPTLLGYRICRLLDQGGEMSQAQMAAHLEACRGSVSKYLSALIDAGYVRLARRIPYVKHTGRTGRRSGVILMYARTSQPLPIDALLPSHLTPAELHSVMASFVRIGKPE